MVRQLITTLILVCAGGGMAGDVRAQEHDAASWVAAYERLPTAPVPGLVGRVLFAEGFAAVGQVRIPALDFAAFDELAYTRAVTRADWSWTVAMNHSHLPEAAKSAPAAPADLERLFRWSGAHAVAIVGGASTAWQLIVRNGPAFTVVDRKTTADYGRSAADLCRWLYAKLGYDGIVVDQRGDLLLVATARALLVPKAQGLLLKNSNEASFLSPEGREGGGIIQLVGQHGTYGVFRKIYSAETLVPLGAKVVLDRSL